MHDSVVLTQSQLSLGELICETGIKVLGVVLGFFLPIACPADGFYDAYLGGWNGEHKGNPRRFQGK